MGGGRKSVGQPIDYRVGIRLNKTLGDAIELGEPVATVFCPQPIPESAIRLLREAFVLDGPISENDLIGDRITVEQLPDGEVE